MEQRPLPNFPPLPGKYRPAGRTLRSAKLRNILWYAADGKCESCGAALDPDNWHADHVIPWHLRRETNVHEMQALCPACNLKKGGRTMELRPFQKRAVDAFKTQATHGKKRFMFLVTPGGGKSTIPYLAALHLPSSLVNAGCWVTPRESLRHQAARTPKIIVDYCQRFGLRVPQFREANNRRDPRRGAWGYSTTYQSIASDAAMHRQEFERLGNNYALFLDEDQFLKDDSTWTNALQDLVDRASALILMSGTWFRGDGKPLAFHPYIQTSAGFELDSNDPDYVTINYSRMEALNDKAILPLQFIFGDARGKFINAQGDTIEFESFDDVDDDNARGAVWAAVNEEAGHRIVRRMIDDWLLYRRTRNRASQSLLVVDSQDRARSYHGWIKTEYSDVNVALAISDNRASRDAVKTYCDGHSDLLITVGMAHVGMDAVAASHMALLTLVRQRGWIEQAIARVVRVNDAAGKWEDQPAVVYTFDDPMMRDITDRIELEQAEILRIQPIWCPPGSNPGTRPGGNIAALYSDLTDARTHELNLLQLDRKTSAHFEHIAAAHNIAMTPIEFHQMLQEAMGLPRENLKPGIAGTATLTEQEDKLKKRLEDCARHIDARRGPDWGATNRECWDRFGKSRQDMNLQELVQAWVWMQQQLSRWGG